MTCRGCLPIVLRACGPTLAAATSSDSAAGAVIKLAVTMVSGEITDGII